MNVRQLVRPAFAHIPDYDLTEGGAVADLNAQAGFGPDEEQRLALDVIFAVGPHAKAVAFETWLIACRQNLKTGVLKQAALGWLYLFKENPVVWTAHEWDLVSEAFTDLDELIGGYPWMSRQVRYIHRGERDQEIGLKNGARLLFKTRTPGGGKGLAGAKVILDEGWKIAPVHMGALLPTLSSRSITGDPQVLGGSSACYATSEVLHRVVARGRAAATDPKAAQLERRFAYLEWCAPPPEEVCERGEACDHGLTTPGCGCDKPELWLQANPAMGRRISQDYIADERRALPTAEFCRERMGWHEAPEGQGVVIPLADWAAGLDANSEPVGPVTLAVVYSSAMDRAAIGLAGKRADKRWHVEVADYRAGTAWVVDRMVGLTQRHEVAGVIVDPRGHESACIAGLEDARIEVTKPTYGDVAAAFSMFFEAVTDSRSVCHRGQDDLTLALAGATTRTVGDAGLAWGRRGSGVDISPIVAVTEAMWGYVLKIAGFEVEPGAWAV